MSIIKKLPVYVCVVLIKIYQYTLGPLLGGACRFYPSCSEYTLQAIIRFGVIRGGWMGAKRIARCNPWVAGGYDPCPLQNKAKV